MLNFPSLVQSSSSLLSLENFLLPPTNNFEIIIWIQNLWKTLQLEFSFHFCYHKDHGDLPKQLAWFRRGSHLFTLFLEKICCNSKFFCGFYSRNSPLPLEPLVTPLSPFVVLFSRCRSFQCSVINFSFVLKLSPL